MMTGRKCQLAMQALFLQIATQPAGTASAVPFPPMVSVCSNLTNLSETLRDRVAGVMADSAAVTVLQDATWEGAIGAHDGPWMVEL